MYIPQWIWGTANLVLFIVLSCMFIRTYKKKEETIGAYLDLTFNAIIAGFCLAVAMVCFLRQFGKL